MVGAVLWQLKSQGQPAIRCVLERLPEGRYRLHLLKGKDALPLVDHDFLDRQAALQASITIYRKLNDNGFHNHPTRDSRPIQ
jgi:hypothetical protein